MPKKEQNQPLTLKRQYVSKEKDIQQETWKKPRKVVKKNRQVSKQQTATSKTSPLNFYQNIQEVPTYYLTVADMKGDPIQLLTKLQHKYSRFGGVKMVVCEAWNAPFTFRYIDKEITTRIQCMQKLKDGKPFEQKVRAYRIQAYEAMAQKFSRQYKYKTKPQGRTQQSRCEQQYWNLVTNPQFQKRPVTVEYAADLSTSIYGSGFPVKKMQNWSDSDFQYETNLFNLNNISKSPSSLLSICEKRKQKISGISFPWLYMGMKFSTFCWHVEDLFVNSLNYNHKGATKTWYLVPGSEKQKFDAYVEKKFQGNSKKKNLLQKIVLMIDPQQLVNLGIKVYKANQRPRQYVCTFFKTYHAGFSHGFNVGQAVNFLSAKSLRYIDEAEKFYTKLQKQKDFKPKALVLSKEWLIHENIMQNKIKSLSTENQIYIKFAYERIIQHEYFYLKEQLLIGKKLNAINSKNGINILPRDYKYEKLSCSYCKNYIYLSAIQCKKCGVLCENHIEQCSCAIGNNKFEIWIRQPNQDRIKTFQQYPTIMKAIYEYQEENKKSQTDSRSLSHDKQPKQSHHRGKNAMSMQKSENPNRTAKIVEKPTAIKIHK